MLPEELSIDRLPPHSQECEQGVLGCILLNPHTAIPKCHELLGFDPTAFYDLRHSLIYKHVLEMSEAQIPVEVISLHERLKGSGLLDQIGGISYLNTLQDSAPSAANVTYYAEVVKEKWLLRRLRDTCISIIESAHGFSGNVDAFIDNSEKQILAVRPQKKAARETIKELVHRAIIEIQEHFERGGEISGLSTGFPDLDHATDGLHTGDLIVPGALPSVGKTSLLMNIAEHVVLNLKKPVAIFSLEMSATQLVKRFMSSHARVNLKGQLYEADFPKLTNAAGKISNSKLFIVEHCETAEEIRAEARRLRQSEGIELMGVDYIQRVRGRQTKESNREQEISAISRTLKATAMELGIPCISPSQLNDDGKLRESRAIGQDADGVWILERDPQEPEKDYSTAEPVSLWVRKNRNGPRDVCVHLSFLKPFTRFESAAKISDEDVPRD